MLYLKFYQLHIITLTMLQKLSRENMNSIVYNTTNRSTSRTHISHQELSHVSPGILTLKCCFSSTDGSDVQNQTKMSIAKRVFYCQVSTMNFLIRVLPFTQRLLCTRDIFMFLLISSSQPNSVVNSIHFSVLQKKEIQSCIELK